MILAAPLVIPFAKAVGLSVGTLGMAALADQVNDYIQANPEESMKILSTIIPNVGIGQIFMSKEDKISLEDLEDMTDEEAQDLSKEEKAELMKQAGKRRNRELSISTAEKIGLTYPDREKQDIEYEVDKRYDEGGVEQKKAPFDYTKFFRKRRADGGAIGIEVLFREKKNLGGLLTGQAKNIYDTMSAAGYFTEDEIRNAIIGAGYEIPDASPTQPEQVTGIIGAQLNQDKDDGPKGDFGIFGDLLKDTAKDFNVEVYDEELGDFIPTTITGYQNVKSGLYQDKFGKNLQPMFSNTGLTPGFLGAALSLTGMKPQTVGGFVPGSIRGKFDGIRDIFNKQKKQQQDIIKQQQEEKARKEREAKAVIAAAEMQQENRDNKTGGYGFGYSPTSDFMTGGSNRPGGGGYGGGADLSSTMGSFKDGGLVTMFVEKK